MAPPLFVPVGAASFLHKMPICGILCLALSQTAGGCPVYQPGAVLFAPGFVREVMHMTLTEILALLGLIGGAILGTFMVTWNIANKKK